jgi:peptide/nickel transport system ATP-binding protein/oligopeptide transport system ATP-binding protein
MMEYRRKMQLIFQDPFASLNPRKTIMQSVEAPLDLSHDIPKAERRERVIKMLDVVGLGEKYLNKYPHELSGGQRQRIVIARALINNPEMVVCDEPVSALDVSVRSQVLNLLKDLQEQMNLAYLFISHDLSVVQYICDKVAVMYLGKIVEIANKEDLFTKPLHPYTKALLSAIPVPDIHHKKEEIILEGEVPSPLKPPKGYRTLLAGDAAADRRGRQAQGCLPALSGNQQLEKRGGEQRCFISTSANIPICRISTTSNTAARRRISPTSPRQAAACAACAWWWRT